MDKLIKFSFSSLLESSKKEEKDEMDETMQVVNEILDEKPKKPAVKKPVKKVKMSHKSKIKSNRSFNASKIGIDVARAIFKLSGFGTNRELKLNELNDKNREILQDPKVLGTFLENIGIYLQKT